MIRINLILFLLTSAHSAFCQSSDIDERIIQWLDTAHITGLSACVIDSGLLVWNGNYGYADRERNAEVTDQTLFMIASCSKTITAAAVMKLVESGRINLDTDINRYLPFTIRHPVFPNAPITVRQLLRHNGSIADNREYLGPFWGSNHGDPTLELRPFLEGYLSQKGPHYDKNKNFLSVAPGETFQYSNVGYALLGYLVETVSGMPFDRFCQTYLFKPLEMSGTGWFLRDVDAGNVAIPYAYNDSTRAFTPYGHGGYPDYPAGQLRTSAKQFANFLIAWTGNGQFQGRQVFNARTIQMLTPDNFMLGFHTWFPYALKDGGILYSHFGGDNGVNSFVGFHPRTKRALAIFTNGEVQQFEDWDQLINLVYGVGN